MLVIVKKKFPDTPEGYKKAKKFAKKHNVKFVLSDRKVFNFGNQANTEIVSGDDGYNL